MDSLVFESDDLGVTEEFLCHAYARMRIGSTTPTARTARVRRDSTTSISVDELDLNFEMSYSVTPLGRICLCVMHEGSVQDHVFHRVRDSFGPGDTVLFAPPDLPYSGRICNARYNITMLDPALLDQVAAASGGRRLERVRLTGHRPRSQAAGDRLKATIFYLRDHVLADPDTAAQPLIVSASSQLLAASVLAAFPNTAQTDPTGQDRKDAHPTTLRRAIAYIEDHADRPITVADIAAAVHVTIRTLQYAFRRHLDTTPMAYLRRVRLAHAHRDLLAADPHSGATVGDVAARWGFAHPGRFAALYRTMYGSSPAETLRD
ncbi:AraC family transcriptional regulator [Streptomyces broussonetiae]|uniref:Helix-turn-helix domain-containing protein n=1 Tax=Streptomyces broussonetiae TaxID=2686304 RepID=A0A6I6NFM8_9ACTN|nr:helix-turn-helix domain-containing protein [Streptomyces broussonetiae]QHA09141.1 helix-turn-helix domain-containing protein [Streptomyces broussonetiae]